MKNRIVNALRITILLSLLLAPVSSAGVRGSGYAQPSDQPRVTLPNAALAQAAPESVSRSKPVSTPAGSPGGQRPAGPSVIQPHPGVPGQPLVEVPDRLRAQSDGTWRSYTNANTVSDLAVKGDVVWAATTGGVVRWSATDGSYVKYTTEDGLADNQVSAVAIDHAGHKWFGTWVSGVSRFDGTTWTTYTTDDGLANNQVSAVAIDHAGHKWFGTSGGVSRFDGTTWTTHTTDHGLASNGVIAIVIDDAGNKWFGTADGVSRFDGSTWTTYTTDDGLAHNRVLAITIDGAGHKWFGTLGGVSRFDGATWTTYTTADGLAGNYVRAIAIDDAGNKWFGTDGGVSVFDGTTWTTYTWHDGLAHNQVRAIDVDDAGHKWFGTDSGVSVFDGTTWTTYTTEDGLARSWVRAIAIDHMGHKWFGFGTGGGGVSVFDGTTWTTYTTDDGLARNWVYAIAIDHMGHKWFGFGYGREGVSRFDGNTWTTYTTEDGLTSNDVYAIAIDHAGHMWFGTGWHGTGGGVSRFDGTTWTTYTTADGLPSDFVRAIASDDAGHMWFGTLGGVSRFDGATWTTYTTEDGLAHNSVWAIAIDDAGHKWFGTYGGVSRFDGTTWTTYTTEDGLAHNSVWAIAIDDAGQKWFGTEDGVSRFDGTTWTTYTTADGLSSNWVWAIAIDDAGQKWFGTGGGVSVFGTESAETYTFSGHVRDGAGDPIAGVTVSVGPGVSATTDTSGDYAITGLITGTYTLTPRKAGYVFAPTSRVVSVPPNAGNADFIALLEAGFVDADRSSVLASPLFVEADGMAWSEVTVTLKNEAGLPVSGKYVQMVSSRGGADIISQPSSPTDAYGMTAAQVRSVVSGTTTVSAWVLGDGVRVNDAAKISFGRFTPLPETVRGEAALAVTRSDRTLDSMWHDTQSIVDEAIYFRGAVGEEAFRLAAGVLGGLVDGWANWSDWRNGVLATGYTFPGWKVVLDSPAWASPAACKISNAFLQDIVGDIEDEELRRLTRITLRGGLYFLTAQKDNACLGDLHEEFMVEGWHISNLIMGHLEKPIAEWPIKGLIAESRAFQQSQLDQVNESRLPPLSQEQVDAYVADLRARSKVAFVLSNRVQDARWTLQSIHSANESDGVLDDTIQTFLRLSAKALADYAFDGAGRLLVGGALTAFESYMRTNALNESILAATMAHGSIAKTAPEAINALKDTTAVGLDQIVRGRTPRTPQGEIASVEHFSEGSYRLGLLWREESSYSMVTIRNTGTRAATFYVVSHYMARTTRLGVPWATLWMTSESTPVSLDPDEVRTVRVDYLTENQGYSPDEGQRLANVPPSPINIDLIAANDEGLFGLDFDYDTDWAPTRTSASGHPLSDGMVIQNATVRTVDPPLVVLAGSVRGQAHQTGFLWANNPFTTSVPVTVTQPIPLGMTPLDSGTGTMDGNALRWTDWAPPLSSRMFTYTFAIDISPGITITLPSATLAMASPAHGVLTDTSKAPPFKVPWAIALTRRTPHWIAPGSDATIVVTATNQLPTPIDGSLTLTVTKPSENTVLVSPRSFSLDGQETQTLSFELPGTLSIGDYRAIGGLVSQGGSAVMFDDPFRVGARSPRLGTTASPVAPDGTIEPGSNLTYSTWLTNLADTPLTDVVISTTIPADTSVVAGTVTDGGSVGGQVVRWHIDTLPVMGSLVRTFAIHLPADYVSEGEGRYVESGAVLFSRESPRTAGESSTVLVMHPKQDEYMLEVTTVGKGEVQVKPDQHTHPYGSVVSLIPTPDRGWTFDAWSGPDARDLSDMSDGSWNLVMDDHKSIIATFAPASAVNIYLPLVLRNP